MYGATTSEKATVIAGKAAHYMLLFGLPCILHGSSAALIGAASYYACQVSRVVWTVKAAMQDGVGYNVYKPGVEVTTNTLEW